MNDPGGKRREPHWITRAQAERIHAEQLAIFGGPSGLRDAGMLESALERPRNKWAYGEDSLPALAAAYAYGIARNHAFVDGNKRIAFAAMIVLLAKNGVEIDLPQPETVEVIMNLAAGALSKSELAAWIGGYKRRG